MSFAGPGTRFSRSGSQCAQLYQLVNVRVALDSHTPRVLGVALKSVKKKRNFLILSGRYVRNDEDNRSVREDSLLKKYSVLHGGYEAVYLR